jgi:hypothetical protein
MSGNEKDKSLNERWRASGARESFGGVGTYAVQAVLINAYVLYGSAQKNCTTS